MSSQNQLNQSTPLKGTANRLGNASDHGNGNNSSPDIPHEVFVNKTIYQFKIILIGDSSVGKTSLVNRFMGYEFDENYSCTISADFKIKSINIDPSTGAELTVWDTCGQEKFRAITRQYFKDAHGIVLVYDVENKSSFDGLSLWLNEIYSNTKADISIVLVANKIDILDRKISKEEGQEFASKNNLLYVETSSKEGINIDEPFEKLATNIIKKIRENPDYVYNETVEQKLKRIGERNAIERQREKEVKCC
jgi:Ras-related protein Rab-18